MLLWFPGANLAKVNDFPCLFQHTNTTGIRAFFVNFNVTTGSAGLPNITDEYALVDE